MESLLEGRNLVKGAGPMKIPDAIKSAIDDISREFGDKRNFRSNLTHVLGIINLSRKSPEAFTSYLFEARSITKQQKNAEKKMPYFFSVLKDISGVKNI
jgi:hypothetical protein